MRPSAGGRPRLPCRWRPAPLGTTDVPAPGGMDRPTCSPDVPGRYGCPPQPPRRPPSELAPGSRRPAERVPTSGGDVRCPRPVPCESPRDHAGHPRERLLPGVRSVYRSRRVRSADTAVWGGGAASSVGGDLLEPIRNRRQAGVAVEVSSIRSAPWPLPGRHSRLRRRAVVTGGVVAKWAARWNAALPPALARPRTPGLRVAQWVAQRPADTRRHGTTA